MLNPIKLEFYYAQDSQQKQIAIYFSVTDGEINTFASPAAVQTNGSARCRHANEFITLSIYPRFLTVNDFQGVLNRVLD
jgi:hypothetical protein